MFNEYGNPNKEVIKLEHSIRNCANDHLKSFLAENDCSVVELRAIQAFLGDSIGTLLSEQIIMKQIRMRKEKRNGI